MRYGKIENYTEYLFSAALQKSQNLHDAEDLTQEVLLSALSYAGEVGNVKAWLSSVLNHKYYDMLRRKYKMPTVCIGLVPEESDFFANTEDDDRPEADAVRREVAYLADKYREVVIRHYLQGEKVQDIANDMGVPKGTVLSRLSAGREQMRKGFDEMKNYEKQSYKPEHLDIGFHGSPGFHDEPWSLVANDMMKQNILIVAYAKPVTCVDIAKALGIPTVYIEQAVDDLVKSELIAKVGSKVFTDFMITTPEDKLKGLDAEIALVDRHYDALKEIINNYLSQIRELSLYERLSINERKKLEHYFVLHLFSSGIHVAAQRILPSKDDFPQRPDGGKWVAIGNRYPLDFDFANYRFGKYCYGGERRAYWENNLGTKSIRLHVYDTQPDLNQYEHGPVEIHEDNLAKLLCMIYKGIPPETVGFDLMFLKDIPHLAGCGVLGIENDKPYVAIPVISENEYNQADNIRKKELYTLADYLEPAIRELLPEMKVDIPKHLEGRIAPLRQYSLFAIPMAMLKKAIEQGDYDIAGATPPMVLAIEEPDGVIK